MNNQNIEIYFPDDNIFDTVSKILIKNGVYETPRDIVDKNDSLILFVLSLTRNFAKEKITEKIFTDSLQKKLNVSPEIAKNIFQKIKEEVLPKAEKVGKFIDDTQVEEKKPTEKKTRTINSNTQSPKIVKQKVPNLPKKNDKYMEPID